MTSSLPLSEQRLTELVLECRTGKITAYNELIEGHVDLVYWLARGWSSRKDDLISAGMFALVDAVHSYPLSGDLGFGIRKWIVSKVGFAIRREHQQLSRLPPHDSPQRSGEPSAFSLLAAKELRERLQCDELDELILDCKLQGYTSQEIAKMSGVAESTIHRRLEMLKKRAR